jgi:hypothetical protein
MDQATNGTNESLGVGRLQVGFTANDVPNYTPLPTGKICELIPKIMGRVGHIPKGGHNKQQGYTFRSIDDVYAALQPILAEEGVFLAPEVLQSTRQERPNKSGGILAFVTMRVKFKVYAPDGSFVEIVTEGEGMDSSDKATNKAMSAAIKYAATTLFWIPTTEPKDSENDHPEPSGRPSVKAPEKPVLTPAKNKINGAVVSKLFVDRGIPEAVAKETIKGELGNIGKKTLSDAGSEWVNGMLGELGKGRWDNLIPVGDAEVVREP